VIGDRPVIIIRPDRKHDVEQLCVVARVFLARDRDRDGSSLLVDFKHSTRGTNGRMLTFP